MLVAIDIINIGFDEQYISDGTISLDFSPAGDWLVAAYSDIHTIQIGNLNSGGGQHWLEKTHCQGDEGLQCMVRFSPDGRYLAAGGYYDMVQVWDFQSGEEVKRFETSFTVRTLEFSPDGQILTVGGDETVCQIWSVISGKLIGQLDYDELTWLTSVSFSHDGRLLVIADDGGAVKVWDPYTLSLIRTLEKIYIGDGLKTVFAPYGSSVAICDTDGLSLHDVSTGEVQWETNASNLTSLAFDPSGAYVASGDSTGAVQFWNAETGALEGRLICPDRVNGLRFSRCRNWMVTAGENFLYLWQLGTNSMTVSSGRFKGAVASVTVEALGQF